MTVQTHPDQFEAVLFADNHDPFVIVRATEGDARVSLFLRAATCDALIAAAAEAKRLLAPPVPAAECGAVDDDWHCTEAAGHAPADHLARVDVGGMVRHRWPADGPGGLLLPADCDPDNAPEAGQ